MNQRQIEAKRRLALEKQREAEQKHAEQERLHAERMERQRRVQEQKQALKDKLEKEHRVSKQDKKLGWVFKTTFLLTTIHYPTYIVALKHSKASKLLNRFTMQHGIFHRCKKHKKL